MKTRPLHEIIAADIDRKEFLQVLGVLLLLVTGISGILGTLTPPRRTEGSREQPRGYGTSPYGQ